MEIREVMCVFSHCKSSTLRSIRAGLMLYITGWPLQPAPKQLIALCTCSRSKFSNKLCMHAAPASLQCVLFTAKDLRLSFRASSAPRVWPKIYLHRSFVYQPYRQHADPLRQL